MKGLRPNSFVPFALFVVKLKNENINKFNINKNIKI